MSLKSDEIMPIAWLTGGENRIGRLSCTLSVDRQNNYTVIAG